MPNSEPAAPRATQIQISGGPIVSLRSLSQSYTYDGLIEGIPTVEMNRRIVASILESEKQRWNDTPYIIHPRVVPIELSRPYPFGIPASIPPIQCVSRWRSPFETREDVDGWAELTIIWYQDGFALPFAPDIVLQIQEINWASHSAFYEL